MGLVKSRRVNDGFDATHAATYEVVVRDRTDVGGKGRLLEIQPHDLVLALLQGPDQTFAEMSCAPSHQHTHRARLTLLPLDGWRPVGSMPCQVTGLEP